MKFIKCYIRLLFFICFCYESMQYSLRNKAKLNIPIEVPTIYKMSTIKPIIPLNTDNMKKIFKKANGPIFVNITKKLHSPIKNVTNVTKTDQMKEKIKELEDKLIAYEKDIKQLKNNQTKNNNTEENNKITINNTLINKTVDVQKNNINNNETSHFNTNETLSINKANITNATTTTIVKNEKKVENNNKTLVTDNTNSINNTIPKEELNHTSKNEITIVNEKNNTTIDNTTELNKNSKASEAQVEASLESELESSIGTRKEYHSNRLSSFIQKDILLPNPCFNKGYYSKYRKVIGTGNYSLCYQSLKLNNTQSINLPMNYTISSHTEKQLISKLLSNDKEDLINYKTLVTKITSICNMNYSSLVQQYYNDSSIDTLCLNLTLFSVYIESYHQVTNDSFIYINKKSNEKSILSKVKNNNLNKNIETFRPNIIVSILSNKQIKHTFIYFFISLLLLVITYITKQKLINFLLNVYSKRINDKVITHSFIKSQLSYQNVKYYLFYSDTSIFKAKHGKAFKYETQSEQEIIPEIVSLCKSDKNLLELMKNNITTDFKWKLSISYNIIFILEIIITCCLFCFLLFNIYNEFGLKYIFTIYLTFNIFCIALLIFLYVYMQLKNEGNRKL